MMRRIVLTTAILLLLAAFPCKVFAQEGDAENISTSTVIYGDGAEDYSVLTDGLEDAATYAGSELHLENPDGIGSLYISFDFPCGFTIRDEETGKSAVCKNEGFLHVFCDLEEKLGCIPEHVVLQFPDSNWIAEIQVFSSGNVPNSVQKWEKPLTGGADIVLFSTHGDDEQLYFAGMLPYYAGERELDVQVVYMTGHSNLSGSLRQHEMLNGLWAVGIRAYPVFGPFPDFKLMDREETYVEYENLGFSRNTLLQFVVESIRQFRPLVAVGHDLYGEYGHGMHQVYADLLTKAVEVSADPETFPESANTYGVWDVPKTYLHLYWENEIAMDWDQPLEAFDGMTAFEVTQKLGFPCHISQQYPLYTNWLYGSDGSITSAAQITQWNPCYFGLYRTTVGEDVQKNDFMENLTSYAELSRQNAEREEELRNTVMLAQAQSAVEPPLLRPPVEDTPEPPQSAHPFPVLAGLTSMVTAAVIFAMLKKIKIFEKK